MFLAVNLPLREHPTPAFWNKICRDEIQISICWESIPICRSHEVHSNSADSAIPSWEGQVKGFRVINKGSIVKAEWTHVTLSLIPKHLRSERVDKQQWKILPAHMLEVQWVQLVSPGANFASSCQQNNSLLLVTVHGSVQSWPAGTVGIALRHNSLITSVALDLLYAYHGSLFTNHLTPLAGCCSRVSCALLCVCPL